jgi:hypothetical protein
MLRVLALSLIVVIATGGCRDATGKQNAPDPAGSASVPPEPKLESNAQATPKPQGANAEDYVPAEFKSGMSRWKDTGVYIDGKPVAFLQFGELPIALKPTWIKDKVSQNKPPGCPECPAWKWAEQRFYRFTDYLKALGIDARRIKMMHVYGPKLSQTIAVTGADLQTRAADEFMFRFGSDIAGKPIPHVPGHFGNGKQPDKINGVMIYIDRPPPTITRDGIELDGVPQNGVPYYGEPLRGGVRVYLDDRLAAIIKRQDLDVKKATKTKDDELHWSFADFLLASGVDTAKVVEGWVIRDDRRTDKIAWGELSKMTFSASAKAHGGVLLGDRELRANAIALHTRAIREDELPVIRPDEEP